MTMNAEQRLIDAFSSAHTFDPSDDLWQRVLHSIEEDRAHRRRVVISVAAALLALATFGLVMLLAVERPPSGLRIDWRTLELAESGLLVLAGGILGPTIRRFGRGYVNDMMPKGTEMGTRLLSLLDVAFYLTVAGYVAITSRFAAPLSYLAGSAGDQLEETAIRLGGLLLALGLLHAVLIMSIPVQSLVLNTTRAGAKLPKWVVVLIALVAFETVGSLPTVFGFLLGR